MAPELNLKVNKRAFIKASDPSLKRYTLVPTNFDTVPGAFQAWVHFIYPKPPAGSGGFSSVVNIVKRTLPELLNYYFPFTGRVVNNPITGAVEVDCNNEGAEFVVAEANLRLCDIDFTDVTKSLSKIFIPFAKDLNLCIQATTYPCGGFSLIVASNHLMTDANTMLTLARSWFEIARDGKPSVIPNHDRSLLNPRSPLSWGPEIERRYQTACLDTMVNVMSCNLVARRLYTIEVGDIDRLRLEAADANGKLATRTEAFSAYVWKALASATGDEDQNCQMGWLVDGRARLLKGPGLSNYAGNVFSIASGEAPVKEISEQPMAHVVKRVNKAIAETANEEHFRDLNDWFEAHKSSIRLAKAQIGLGSPSVVISSCHNMRLNGDFGFGRPALVVPHIPWERLASCFMLISRNPKDDGSWTVIAYVWPKLAAVLEAGPTPLFRPTTAESVGLVDKNTHVELLSKL